jgi:phytoene dehydrogenase-like protein
LLPYRGDVSSGTGVDAVVVGGGPNGLAAGIALAAAGRSVRLYEAADTVGGGCRSAELTEPGVIHDVCSAIHPLARSSPFFNRVPLADHGLEWVEPPIELAHPLDEGRAALVHRAVGRTADGFDDPGDGRLYRRWMGPLSRDWPVLAEELLGPFNPAAGLRHPVTVSRFALPAILPMSTVARRFRTPEARALLAGVGAHSFLRLSSVLSAGVGVGLLVSAHAVGWPMPKGGSGRIVEAMASHLRSLGGEIETGRHVRSLSDVESHRAAILDLTPRQVLSVAGHRLRGLYAAQLRRYRYGPAAFKLDLVLDAPIPWTNPAVGQAGTVHVAGRLEEVEASEAAVHDGRVSERPFVLVAQPTQFDPTRAPAGRHVVWAYCHVPNGWTGDATTAIEAQIERFAPGFRDLIRSRHVIRPAELERYNENDVGGDINGGLQDWRQFFTRPAIRWNPYTTPDPGIFIGSSSTPPGGGVHGLCGMHAANAALRGVLR